MNELLLLLLPVAAFTGWYLAQNDGKNSQQQKGEDYFQGLSYLLEDQTDKAIDAFVKMAHLDDSTVENQITLGNLFRHRGEIDRALHIHSSLQNKSHLTKGVAQKLNLALADDYFVAGIMNRAEKYYQAARDDGFMQGREVAERQLVKLYAEQAQWEKAIEIARALDPYGRDALQQQVAHFYCEMADATLNTDEQKAASLLKQALNADKACVRASMSLGQLALKRGHYVAAIQYFEQIERQNPAFLVEVLDALATCYLALSQADEWRTRLNYFVEHYQNPILILRLNQLIEQQEGAYASLAFLRNILVKNPNILTVQAFAERAAELNNTAAQLTDDSTGHNDMQLLSDSIDRVLARTLKYRCRHCGFRGNQLNWQCPGCHQWGSFTPVSDVSLKERS